METIKHRVDFCVVGGGLAGMSAAIAAARKGVRVALIQDRPVLGGNASSEIRMHVCGAHGENNRETGIVEELKLENRYRNPLGNYSIWDSILYEKVRFEPNIDLLLNCSVCDLTMSGNRIRSVKGWQLTTYTWHVVEAELFADCSGDSILAPLSGAEFRVGREAGSEFGESIAPENADRKTMGMSCLIQGRQTQAAQPFIPPSWVYRYDDEGKLEGKGHTFAGDENFWWMEVGGTRDSIRDTEELRDELLKIAFGVWDHIKNRGSHSAENWSLEWAGFLPGKRESRRYVGDHVLTQNDIRGEGRFDDLVAYGGWSMDDHFPDGFYHPGLSTIFHPAPSPYGIPYRSLYSRNIENLLFAGRNISATHAALSSTRVMATCAVIGQAAGTAAAVAIPEGLSPRGVYENRMEALKQALMEDDCYLPFNRREMTPLTASAALSASAGDPSVLRNGIDRPVGGRANSFTLSKGGWVGCTLPSPTPVASVRVVFDSDLGDEKAGRMPSAYRSTPEENPDGRRVTPLPGSMARSFTVEYRAGKGDWTVAAEVKDNHTRLYRAAIGKEITEVRLAAKESWGSPDIRLFAFDLIG